MSPRKKWLTAAVLVAAGLTLVSMADARGFRRYWKIQDDLRQLADKNRALNEQNAKLSEEIEALRKDPRALERAAREELGFVKPGEIIINVE
jgi:cell division protein FtsB